MDKNIYIINENRLSYGRGYVYCPTKTGKWTNLITDGIYYQDETFGKVQIIAADPRQFPCGTVM